MMKKIKYIILTLSLIAGFGVAMFPVSVSAVGGTASEICAIEPSSPLCTKPPMTTDVFITTLVNTLLYILGAVSVIVIIFAGIFYATSNGDATLVTKAKNTLMYAVIGLIVAIMAYAIVNFVIGTFYPPPTLTSSTGTGAGTSAGANAGTS